MSFSAALLALALASTALASDEPDDLVNGKLLVITAHTLRFTGKPPVRGESLDLPNPTNDPTREGGTLLVTDTGGGAGSETFELPAAQWQRVPPNTTRPLRGYRYRGTASATDPCRLVLVKRKVVKALCSGPGVSFTPPVTGEMDVVLTIGTDSKRYCASFGGKSVKTRPTMAKRRNALAPAACPASAACACGGGQPEQVVFTNGVGSGSCGSVTGGSGGDIACGGLYFGGGLDAVPLPIIVPDFVQPTRFRVDACSGTNLTVAGSTQAETGSNRDCTTQGCLFGPPLPVPNAESAPTSTCLYNVVATTASGSLACDTGAASITLPLLTGVFLTGDLLPNRCQGGSNPGGRCTAAAQATDCPGGTCVADPDIQACPICNPTTKICNGGMDNGMSCVPGSSQSTTGQFPTSQDCRIADSVKIGDLDVRLGLTTGTSSDTAAPSGTQQRVFCGFCRDADLTGSFQGPPAVPCASNADCAQPFEACEQRNQGAFGNGGATGLSATGSSGGPLTDFGPHPATLVSVFCIPPVYNQIIDGQADLPGPGALTLPGTVRLSASGAFVDATAASTP